VQFKWRRNSKSFLNFSLIKEFVEAESATVHGRALSWTSKDVLNRTC
jgi:hypothetical protein